jgi:thiol-disulfide isomerase/thioredoxin
MKLFNLFVLLIVFAISEIKAQTVCFEKFQAKVITPWQQALEKAGSDKEKDSLYTVFNGLPSKLKGCQMPAFKATTLKRVPVSNESLKGKVVVMNLWYIGCKPCLAELPALNKLVAHYKGKDVVFLSFASSARGRVEKEFLPKHPFSYQHIPDAKPYESKFLVSASPTNMVFDQGGKLQYISTGGFVDERAKTAAFNEMSPVIDQLLTKMGKEE